MSVRLSSVRLASQNETIRRSVNIDSGVIQKPAILAFQRRRPDYPHESITAGAD